MKQITNKITLLLTLFIICSTVVAQNIEGRIINADKSAIEGATVVLCTCDSTTLDIAVTNKEGRFAFAHSLQRYRLIVQCIGYRATERDLEGAAGDITLEPLEGTLQEFVYTEERPLVKVVDGALRYDLTRLTEHSTASNAYEAVKKIPGVTENDGKLSLIGSSSLTVVINGKPTTMNSTQLTSLLSLLPIDRIEAAEVIYNAPPQYHTRGGVINLILKGSKEHSFQGEVAGFYKNSYYNHGDARASMRYTTPKWAFDLNYSFTSSHTKQRTTLTSLHNFRDSLYNIVQQEELGNDIKVHNIRAAAEYNISEKSNITLSYTSMFIPDAQGHTSSIGNLQTSGNTKNEDDNMHNISLQTTWGCGLSAGGDYTRYTSENNQNIISNYTNGTSANVLTEGRQAIDSYHLYADQSHALSKGWKLGYGISYKHTRDEDYMHYLSGATDFTPNVDNTLREHTANIYASLSKQFATGTSFTLSLQGEYYNINDREKWAVYPQASLTYIKNTDNIFQLSFSTNKQYPQFWAMQSTVTYIDGYSEIHSTPGLHAMTTYNLNASYILKQKYVASIFHIHNDNLFAQMPYQSQDRLALIYKMYNWNYQTATGANITLPIKAGSWYDSRFVLTGVYTRQRCDDYYAGAVKRDKLLFIGMMNNSFIVNNDLSFELNGFVQTPAQQGTFDIGTMSYLTIGGKYKFIDDKATLSVQLHDIFNTTMGDLSMNYKGQNIHRDEKYYSRTFTIGFTYSFGGYQKQEKKEIDTSRFGH